MPPLDDMVNAAWPIYYLYQTQTGSAAITTVMTTGISIILIGVFMTVFTSTTRVTWAWARDGGLPAYFGLVDGKQRVPIRAVLLTCLIVGLLSLLNIGQSSFIALGALNSLSTLSLYFSYAIMLTIALHKRLTDGLPKAEWSMGRYGTAINVFALVYTAYTMIWLPFPATLPVQASTMNYAGPIFLAVMSGAVGMWFTWAKTHWPGPNQAVVDRVLKNSDK